jgi:hypothetical protein
MTQLLKFFGHVQLRVAMDICFCLGLKLGKAFF